MRWENSDLGLRHTTTCRFFAAPCCVAFVTRSPLRAAIGTKCAKLLSSRVNSTCLFYESDRIRWCECWFLYDEGDDNDILIHTLCIVSQYQNNGIGTAVTKAIIADAVSNGRGVMISVLKTNPRAERLYARLGFEVVDETLHHRHMRYRECSID